MQVNQPGQQFPNYHISFYSIWINIGICETCDNDEIRESGFDRKLSATSIAVTSHESHGMASQIIRLTAQQQR